MLEKLMTTKYPLGPSWIELAHQLSGRRMVLRAAWVLRLQTEAADAHTKFDFRYLKTATCIEVSLESLRFGVLDRLLESGETYFAEVEAAKLAYEKQRAEEHKSSTLRKGKGEGLRETDPWPA